MLRAALIGFPSTGKTTLFQLMTAAREQTRAHGRGEAAVGISKVPDARLDRLTAMFNPRKRVPATVEFADIGGAATGAAQALVDVAAIATRTRSSTLCARSAMIRCRTCPARSIQPATRRRWKTS